MIDEMADAAFGSAAKMENHVLAHQRPAKARPA